MIRFEHKSVSAVLRSAALTTNLRSVPKVLAPFDGRHIMKKTAMILVAAASCLSLPLTTVSVNAKQPTNKEDPQSDDNKIRCRKLEVTGSLVKKTKVCRTVAEWRAISTKGNQNVRDIVESGQVCAGGPCAGGN